MSKRRPTAEAIAFDPNEPTRGDFYADGSWNPDGDRPLIHDPIESLYWFVDMLVTKRRRDPACPPWEFANRIRRSRFARAFPQAMDGESTNRSRWTCEVPGVGGGVAIPWFAVGTSRITELVVKHSGYGCGDGAIEKIEAAYVAETRARGDLLVDESLVRKVLKGDIFDGPPEPEMDKPSRPIPIVGDAPNENWPGWRRMGAKLPQSTA